MGTEVEGPKIIERSFLSIPSKYPPVKIW